MRRLISSLLLSIGIAAAFGYSSVGAVDELSQHITVSPAVTDIAVLPGEVYHGVMVVRNDGTGGFSVALSSSGYQTKNLTYDPIFKPISQQADVRSWISFDRSSIDDLTPGEAQSVAYSITVPSEAQAGGYYAVLFAQSTPTDVTSQSIVRHNRVGDILYITVKGEIKKGGGAVFEPTNWLSFNDKQSMNVKVQNTGGAHFKAKYSVQITDLFGKNVFEEQSESYILPQTERVLSFEWHTSAPLGLYTVERTVEFLDKSITTSSKVLRINPMLGLGLILVSVAAVLLVFTRRQSKRRGTQ